MTDKTRNWLTLTAERVASGPTAADWQREAEALYDAHATSKTSRTKSKGEDKE